ncbi:type I pantothenate kinase [Coxiella endosymbiont of Amblyomma americanum]|uniref:type I pantothenate kinase n=1 Tax=Coxiella endosymbiont of Amblyomma americanum TaxID=325775 RepID=UPI000581B7EB|nr:type I pantothenate kinase [Coxiella endosymbiont of Amblyomma americanum]AJC50405.1 pantothenate kinase [Coxiella endosymbiont of Amblyomma americanum]
MNNFNQYLRFTREEWRSFLKSTAFACNADNNFRDTCFYQQAKESVISLKEIKEIYLPLSQLLSIYVTAQQVSRIYDNSMKLKPKIPYIIGISGSVVAGKSTTSQVLKILLSRCPNHPNVKIVTTDGFLYSNARLARQGLMNKKGFPESYNMKYLLQVFHAIKSGERNVPIPIYSHHYYDVIPDKYEIVNQPDIVIFEGLNLLKTFTRKLYRDDTNNSRASVSNFFDFFVIIDAKVAIIKNWYIDRILSFWYGIFRSPDAYFHYLTSYSKKDVVMFAKKKWKETNEVNFLKNILPFRYCAQLILEKTDDHSVQKIYLKKAAVNIRIQQQTV